MEKNEKFAIFCMIFTPNPCYVRTLNAGLTMKPQVKSVCKLAYFELHIINSVRRTKEAAATAIHAIVTSRLDVCKSPLYGLPKVTLFQVQRVQNSAANCLVGAKQWEHISPVLSDLHWLPIIRRVEYKILVLLYKALMPQSHCGLCLGDASHWAKIIRTWSNAGKYYLKKKKLHNTFFF